MKLAFALFFVVYSVNCQFVAASNFEASDKVAQSLHSQIKHVESEIMRKISQKWNSKLCG